jgi:hypothetical protein
MAQFWTGLGVGIVGAIVLIRGWKLAVRRR